LSYGRNGAAVYSPDPTKRTG